MKKFNFAIAGAGNIGQIHARAIQGIPNAQLIAITDRNQHKAKQLAQQYSARPVSRFEEIIIDPQIDIISICTPSGTHAKLAMAAATHGKHLLVEKPLDIQLDRIDQMIATAQHNQVILAGVFPSRFRIGTQKTYEAIQNGRLGKIMFIHGSVKWFREDDYYAGSWRGTWELDGGGALMNQSIHTIDLVQWFGGPIKTVYGKTATRHHQIEAEDTATAMLDFENGAQGIIQGATSCWPGDPARIEIHGNQGTVALEEGRIVRWDLQDATKEEELELLALDEMKSGGSQDPMGINYEFHQRQMEDLLEAISNDRPPAIIGTEARKAVEIVLAIYQSADSGKPVVF